MASRRDGEDWLEGRPAPHDPEPREVPPDWRPLPAPLALLLVVGFTVGVYLLARDAHSLDDHFSVFVIAVCGPGATVQLARFVLRRRHALMQPFSTSRVRLALLATPAGLAAAGAVAGLPPEDLALAALPAALIGDEALIALGVGDPRETASA